jgi:NADP-dependent 3-hydroxy acid dehydrogenase YdfG
VSNDIHQQVVVSGASSGIGQCIARHLLTSGWRVLGLDIAPPSLTDAAYKHHVIDLSDLDAIEKSLSNVDAFG